MGLDSVEKRSGCDIVGPFIGTVRHHYAVLSLWLICLESS